MRQGTLRWLFLLVAAATIFLFTVPNVIAQRRGGFSPPPPPPPPPYRPPPRPYTPPAPSRPVQPTPRPTPSPMPQKVNPPSTPYRTQPRDPKIVTPSMGSNQNRGPTSPLKRDFNSAANRPRITGFQSANTAGTRNRPVLSLAQRNTVRASLRGKFNNAASSLTTKFNKAARRSLRDRFRSASGAGKPPIKGGAQSGASSGGGNAAGSGDFQKGSLTDKFKKSVDKPSPEHKPDIVFDPDNGGVKFKPPKPSGPKP